MAFKVDFINGKAVSWRKEKSKVERRVHEDYFPRFYIEGDISKLQKSRVWLTRQDGVDATCFEKWKPTLSKPRKKVLRIDCQSNEELRSTANLLKKKFGRSTFRFYNVGFSPQFRFCLQKQICPIPDNSLTKIELGISRKDLADQKLSELRFNGKKLGGSNREALKLFKQKYRTENPDIVVLSSGQLLELIKNFEEKFDSDFSLGRLEKFQQLAGENTVSSYGRTVHSAARYNIPGRIVIDRSNSFLLEDATLPGLWDLVERSYRPMQELAWGSIGRVLTSIEVKKAYLEENTLTPWKNWDGEEPKKASTMHKADRGGFIFNPEPGIHRDVYEADFASLFPNIMVKKNISPETVCCNCCSNNRTPELDYSICEKQRGFISEVLKPLVEDRQKMKDKIGEIDDEERRKNIQGSIDSIKWILVSCFGYMGHAHASYGAIKCHQAIQAFDREIMVKTKEIFEDAGYSIAHGIIDSIWIQKNSEDAKEFEQACRKASEEIGIKLEPEHRFEWCAFVPRSSSEANISTLNRYFGKNKDGSFKTAGIEAEQRSTCKFVKEAQMEMIKALDKDFEADDALKVLKDKIGELRDKKTSIEQLVKTRRISKTLSDYKVKNRGFAAVKRAKYRNIDLKPGQSAHFVVRNDDAEPLERVRLKFEAEGEYDTKFYRKQLIRAAESVLSPLGLDREEIRNEISKNQRHRLTDY